jgi:hypothetical protein
VQADKLMFAILEFADYGVITVIVSLVAGGSAAVAYSFRPSDAACLARVERKLDAILRHLKVECVDPTSADELSEEVKKLADDPGRKNQAIKLHREQTGLGLKDAKDAVEAYVDDK